MAITGAGLGLMNQTFHMTAQNAVPLRAIGATTGLMQFSRALGTALGVTLFGTIIIAGAPEGALAHGTLVRRLSSDDRLFAVVFFFLKERPLRTSLEDVEAEIV
jgi:hypothetical protein